MQKISLWLLVVVMGSWIYLTYLPLNVAAASCDSLIHFVGQPPPPEPTGPTYDFTVGTLNPGDTYQVIVKVAVGPKQKVFNMTSAGNGNFSASVPTSQLFGPNNYEVSIKGNIYNDGQQKTCSLTTFTLPETVTSSCTITFKQNGYTNPACLMSNTSVEIQFDNVRVNGSPYNGDASAYINQGQPLEHMIAIINPKNVHIQNGSGSINGAVFDKNSNNVAISLYYFPTYRWHLVCTTGPGITLKPFCSPEEQSQTLNNSTSSITFDICNQVKPEDKAKCVNCVGSANNLTKNVWTGLGCIKTDTKGLVTDLMRILFGIAGGIALILMLYGAFTYTAAGGDPKRAQEAREIFTAAITGLLLIIFSVFILNFIGISLLNLNQIGF